MITRLLIIILCVFIRRVMLALCSATGAIVRYDNFTDDNEEAKGCLREIYMYTAFRADHDLGHTLLFDFSYSTHLSLTIRLGGC